MSINLSKTQKEILKVIRANDYRARSLVIMLERLTTEYYDANQASDCLFFVEALSHRPVLAKAAKKIIERVTPIDCKKGANKKLRKGANEVYKAAQQAFVEAGFESLQDAAAEGKKKPTVKAYDLDSKVSNFDKAMAKAVTDGDLSDSEAITMHNAMQDALRQIAIDRARALVESNVSDETQEAA